MKYILIAFTIIVILFSFPSKESTISPLHSTDTILAFGDSLTYGYNAKPSQSYPSILSQLSHHKVINAGIPGETSADGLQRLPALLEDENIKLMLLCFGGNDIMQGVSMQSLKLNLKTMIHRAKEKQIQVVLIAVPNFTLFGLKALALYAEVADEENIALIDNMLADILAQPSLKSDQIHPNALGYKIIGEQIYKRLKEENLLSAR